MDRPKNHSDIDNNPSQTTLHFDSYHSYCQRILKSLYLDFKLKALQNNIMSRDECHPVNTVPTVKDGGGNIVLLGGLFSRSDRAPTPY